MRRITVSNNFGSSSLFRGAAFRTKLLATAEKRSAPAVLQQQVSRMLADPKSSPDRQFRRPVAPAPPGRPEAGQGAFRQRLRTAMQTETKCSLKTGYRSRGFLRPITPS
jgi:hypothetical protein